MHGEDWQPGLPASLQKHSSAPRPPGKLMLQRSFEKFDKMSAPRTGSYGATCPSSASMVSNSDSDPRSACDSGVSSLASGKKSVLSKLAAPLATPMSFASKPSCFAKADLCKKDIDPDLSVPGEISSSTSSDKADRMTSAVVAS